MGFYRNTLPWYSKWLDNKRGLTGSFTISRLGGSIILFKKYFLPFFMSIEIISTKKSHATGIAMVIFFSSSMHSFHMLEKIDSYAKFFVTKFTFPISSTFMNNWKKNIWDLVFSDVPNYKIEIGYLKNGDRKKL